MSQDIFESIDHLDNNFEYAEYLQNNILGRAAGGNWDSKNYKLIRQRFLADETLKNLLPDYIRTCRDIEQFWNFIKTKFSGNGCYGERKQYIHDTFQDLLGYLEEQVLNNNGSSIIKLSKVEKVLTIDQELNILIEEAKKRFENPKDKQIALEKLWDSFERIKTYFDHNKSKSAEELVKLISSDFDYEFIKSEFQSLTTIGNDYRIRHHETNRKDIKDIRHVEYLFFRMLALLNLCVANIQENETK